MAIPGIESAERAIAQLARDRHQDADETRRLLYMALIAPRCKRYNLAGTLINALAHHRGDAAIASDALMERVMTIIEGTGDDDDEAWIREQIQRCTDALGGN